MIRQGTEDVLEMMSLALISEAWISKGVKAFFITGLL